MSLIGVTRYVAVASALVATLSAVATPSLDPTFGAGTGRTGTDIGLGNQSNGGSALARLSDGRLVIVGSCVGQNDYDFCVARFTSDGALDMSFNGSGTVVTPVGPDQDVASSVAAQADGKIVVAGRCGSSPQAVCVVRYTTSGGLDPGFNSTGKAITALGTGQQTEVTAVALQSDQKIVVSGFCSTGNVRAFCLVRYNTDGTLDQSFNSLAPPSERGKLVTQLAADSMSQAMVIQPDQKIVQVGQCSDGMTGGRFCVARFNLDGSLDASFNGSGISIVSVNGGDPNVATAVALQGNGAIVLAGNCYGQGYDNICVQRYTANGAVDTSFGVAGAVVTTLGSGPAYASAAVIQTDGRIVVVGSCTGLVDTDFCSLRLNADGSIDPSFGASGKLITPVTASSDSTRSALIQPDGKLVLGGACVSTGFHFCVIRYAVPCTMDIDGDGAILATTDALLFARIALGLTGSAVTQDVNFPPTATRKTWPAIRDHLNGQCGMSLTQ